MSRGLVDGTESSVFEAGYHTPSHWVRRMNTANRMYEQYLSQRKEWDLRETKETKLTNDMQALLIAMSGDKTAANERTWHMYDGQLKRLENKRQMLQRRRDMAMIAWRTAMENRNNLDDMPFWDTTGMKTEGRFQFRTGCMARKGNDCGCYLVDTLIEQDDRSSCTKGEYLSGIDEDPGYGKWDNSRVFMLAIKELEFGDTSTNKIDKVLAGKNPSIFLRGKPIICYRDDDLKQPLDTCAETRVSSSRTIFRRIVVTSDKKGADKRTQALRDVSWRGDSTAVWYLYVPKEDQMTNYKYVIEVVSASSRQ